MSCVVCDGKIPGYRKRKGADTCSTECLAKKNPVNPVNIR